ncbi:MAG: hypothetical protein GC162_09890 [Planctomycetes bacterium]|nr:hypothetical protein [Planctomycetota bacterium]
MSRPSARKPAIIEIRIAEVNQLFNSLDPSPFPEKDLDQDAEEFIVSWATEEHRRSPFHLRIHLTKPANDPTARERITEAVHAFFAYRASITRRRLRRLLATGRSALIIGVLFLAACVLAADLLIPLAEGRPLMQIARESLIIGGWVAMWRPMEIFLYEWWPIRHERRVYDRLSVCDVEVVEPGAGS